MFMKQYGGEGKEAYKGKVNDASLKQHGGEGKQVSKMNDTKLGGSGSDCGPGRNLKVTSN
jgi:hypothetical protein